MNEKTQEKTRWTIGEVLTWTTGFLQKKGVPSARLDAEILLAHALESDRVSLYLNFDRPLTTEERARYRELVGRRARREPVALITGVKEFWSVELRVVSGALIPRPDTEVLVEASIEAVDALHATRVLEIGAGTGAVSIALAKERPGIRILATDLDKGAAGLARGNAETAGFSPQVDFLCADLFTALRPAPTFDLIVSNPPYVPTDDIAELEPEVADFEPRLALDGGPDGLDVIRRITQHARSFLNSPGALLMEIGHDQGPQVEELIRVVGGFAEVRFYKDTAGRTRVVRADVA